MKTPTIFEPKLKERDDGQSPGPGDQARYSPVEEYMALLNCMIRMSGEGEEEERDGHSR